MNKSGKIVLAAVIAVAAIISTLAIATHLRESVEDSGKKGPENETPTQALKETLSGEESGASEQSENETTENGGK